MKKSLSAAFRAAQARLPLSFVFTKDVKDNLPDVETLSPEILRKAVEYGRSMNLLAFEAAYGRHFRKDHFFRLHIEELCKKNCETLAVLENPAHPVTISRILKGTLSKEEEAAVQQISTEMLEMPQEEERKTQLLFFVKHPWFFVSYDIRYTRASVQAWEELAGYGIHPALLRTKNVLAEGVLKTAEEELKNKAEGVLKEKECASSRKWMREYKKSLRNAGMPKS